MKDIKMSDVFDLPLVPNENTVIYDKYDSDVAECPYDCDAVAITHAVNNHDKLMEIIQMCFEDSCKPSGKLTKKTVLEVMKYADTRA